jgi:sporulation protein YlmC with PRC-barrel domain
MKAFKYSAATLALLLASGMAYAQDSTTTTTQPTATVECPVAGSVPEAELTAECKAKMGVSTSAAPKTDSGAATTDAAEAPATTTDVPAAGTAEAPATMPDDGATASTEPPATTNAGAAISSANSILASEFIGQVVYSTANENIGEINDLVMGKDQNGGAVAIIGVGGFLGLGEKDVAIPFADISVTRDENNLIHLTIAATKEQLEAAPTFDRTALK